MNNIPLEGRKGIDREGDDENKEYLIIRRSKRKIMKQRSKKRRGVH